VAAEAALTAGLSRRRLHAHRESERAGRPSGQRLIPERGKLRTQWRARPELAALGSAPVGEKARAVQSGGPLFQAGAAGYVELVPTTSHTASATWQ
jgi:hypothetical protein